MKYNNIIIILFISILMVLACGVTSAYAAVYTDKFDSGTHWTTSGDAHISGGNGYVKGPDSYLKYDQLPNGGAIYDIEFDAYVYSNASSSWSIRVLGGFSTSSSYALNYNTHTYFIGIGSNYAMTNYDSSYTSYDKWQHIRIVSDGTTGKIYVDGVLVGSYTKMLTMDSDANGGLKLYTSQSGVSTTTLYDNFYWDTTTTNEKPPDTTNTTFNGYIKDANGNPLEYCNVTLWSGNAYGTYLNSDITDANGYYTFGPVTITPGNLYNISIKPPNSYYTNLYGFTANATTPLTLNFTVNPARVQIYAYDASKGIATGDLNAVNFTLYVSGGGLPGTVTYVRIAHDSPYIFDENIPTGANVSILANKSGFVDKWNNFTSVSGWNTPSIAMSGDYSSGGYVLILGHVRDNTGTKLTGIPVYLVRADTNATVSAAVSSNNLLVDPGYYALRVPISAVDYQYKIIGTFPGYGNLTCDLRQGGATGDIGVNDIITYDATWTTEGLASNAEMGVDPWFSLAGTYTPSATATPSPGGNVPNAPTGYNVIAGQVYNVATGQNIIGVPVYMCYQNGTLISSTTTDASGSYSFTFATAGLSTQSLIVKPGTTAQFTNTTSTTYVSYPFSGGATAYRNDIGMTAVQGYQTYKMSGWLYDAVKGENYRVSGGTVSVWTQDGNTQISIVSVDGNGHYELYLGQDLTPGTYIVSGQSVGYKNNNGTFEFPHAFMTMPNPNGMYNLSIAMEPTAISADNNNAIGIQIVDNATGLILNHAQYTIKYATNGTVYASGGMGGQYVVYLYNLPAADYLITASYTGYTSLTYGKTIAANNWYNATIRLNAIPTPTALPTATPTPTGTPTMYTNPFDALIHLLVLAGLDEATANLVVGFIFIIGGAAAMAIIGAKIGLVGNVGMPMLIGIGAASGFALACLTNVWPSWLLLVGAFVVVIYVVYAFVAPRGGP